MATVEPYRYSPTVLLEFFQMVIKPPSLMLKILVGFIIITGLVSNRVDAFILLGNYFGLTLNCFSEGFECTFHCTHAKPLASEDGCNVGFMALVSTGAS